MYRKWGVAVALLALVWVVPAGAQWGRGRGWAGLVPTTPEQKAYLDEAQRLRDRIWERQLELQRLQTAEKPSQAAIQAKRKEIEALQDELCQLNFRNRKLRWEMMDAAGASGAGPGWGGGPRGGGRGLGRGACRGLGGCPWGGPANCPRWR